MKTNPALSGRVVVVGGGNTAIDAARTSLRLGAKEVILLYRRTRNEMPANKVEIDAAEQEGVKLEILAAPVRVNVEMDRLVSVQCIRMELGEPDASGRRRPVEIKGSEYMLPCDWVISAIGQEADLHGVVEDTKIKVTKWKTISAKQGTFDTDRPGVFAGGDVVTGPADAIDAIAAGRNAARAIDKYIKTGIVERFADRFESRRDNFHKLTKTDLPNIELSDRHHPAELAPMERILGFDEVEMAYDRETAIAESLRCAECGCDAGLACRLQDYCTEYGVDQTRFVGAYNKYKVDTRHPYIKIDSNKCIRCGRCVNICSEILNISALGFVNRGFRTIVKPALEKALQETNCVSCGNCIDVCPTGALVEKMPFRRSGPWKMDSVYNVCNYCSIGCNITLKVKTPDLFFVVGAPPATEPNHGELCMWGRFGYQHYLDGSRETRPMVKRSGKLVPVSWDEAFEEVKKGLSRILSDHTPDQVMVAASPKLSNEELYLAGRFARAVVGTNNISSFHRMVNEADYHALDEILGGTYSGVGPKDIENADLYIVLGGNPTVETPVLGWQMKRKMKQGTEAVIINSTEIDLAAYAQVWADPRRGTITTLLNGIISELIRRNAIDTNYIASKTVNFEQVKENLLKHDLGEVASITGVSTAKLQKIVEILSDRSKKVVAYYHMESRIERSANDLKALVTLLSMLGKIGVEGSGLALVSSQCNTTGMQIAGFDNRLLPGGVKSGNASALKKIGEAWKKDLGKTIDGSGTNIGRKIREDKIRAAIVLGENPAVAPEYNSFINNLEFLVVADMFLTETAQSADVFLPLSGYLETPGHLTNWSGLQQQTHPICEPMNGLSTVAILKKLSVLAGYSMNYNGFDEITAELNGFIQQFGIGGRFNGKFLTEDGKAHFMLYSDQVIATSAAAPKVLEIDARMIARSKK